MSSHVVSRVLRRLTKVLAPLALVAAGSEAAAQAQLNITPITWNVIGLDSNNPAVGPNRYPVGARVCNIGTTTATNVNASIFFDGGITNPYLSIFGKTLLSVDSLPAGSTPASPYRISQKPANCADFYFLVDIARNSNAYSRRVSDTATPAQRNTQLFHIEATADGLGTVSTPPGRELYVEKIISQGRNAIQQFSGPANVVVGGTYTYTLNATTAPGGYEQLEVFTNFPNNIFQIMDVSTTYTSPGGGINSTVYADACGWENNRASSSYHNNLTCTGPENYSGAKAGDVIRTSITVKILSAGTATVQSTINDFSGSSYHYNADFGDAINAFTITATLPVNGPDLTISKTHTPMSVGSTGNYILSVSNVGGTATSGQVTVTDTLPTGVSPTAASGTGWTCSPISGQTVTCRRSDALPSGTSYPDITIATSVTTKQTGLLTNTATVAGGGDTNTTNNSASDPTNITASVNLGITKVQTTPAAGTSVAPGAAVTYTITVTNPNSSSDADGAVFADPAVSGFNVTSVTCSSSSGKTTCPTAPITATQLQDGVTIPTFVKNTSLTFTVTGTAVANSAYKITNTATISPATGSADTNTADNIATATTNIQNPPPVANNDNTTTTVNTAKTFSVTSNDTDTAPGTVNAATVDLVPSSAATRETTYTVTDKGTFTVDDSGDVTFTPATGFSGIVTATYLVRDNVGAASTQPATITVTVNPTAAPDTNTVTGNLASSTTKNSVTTTVLSNDAGSLNNTTVVFPTQTSGTVTNAGKTLTNIQGTYMVTGTGAITFTPADGFIGVATPVTYQVSDGSNLLASSTLTITVNTVNAPPVARTETNVLLLSTAPATPLSAGLSATDPDGTVASYTISTLPASNSGVLALGGTAVSIGQVIPASQIGTLTFDPAAGFNGNASFTYTATDNQNAVGNTATYTIPVNVPPTANTDNTSTNAGTAKTFSITGNDTDVTPGTVNAGSVDLVPSSTTTRETTYTDTGKGTFTVDNSGDVTFTPTPGFSGTATATYTVQDNQGATSSPATITVTVRPTAADDVTSTPSTRSVNVNVVTNDAGSLVGTSVIFPAQAAGSVTNNGKTLTVTGQGQYDVQPDGTITFAPAANYAGTATAVTYQVSDTSGQTATATLTVTVSAPASAPDLILTKKVSSAYAQPSTATVGNTITYTLKVSNSGSVATSGTVRVVDTLPAGLTAAAIGGTGWTCDLPTLTCTRSDALGSGSSYPAVTLTVQAPLASNLETNAALRDFTNSAAVSGGNEAAANTGNNTDTANVKMVYAKLAKKVRNLTAGSAFGTTSSGRPGQVLEYCIDFTNYGGASLSNFKITDNVPGNTAALTTGYDADEPGTATGFGVQLTLGTTTYLTSSADTTDTGKLTTSGGSFGAGLMEVILPSALAPDATGSACFKATIN